MGLFVYMPFNLKVFNPLKEVIKDFKFTDLYYSNLRNSTNLFDREVVLVNIGDADRAEIANIINTVNAYEPRVIALDILFADQMEPASDSLLKAAFSNAKDRIILSNHLEENHGDYTQLNSHDWFGRFDKGYANFVGAKPTSSTIRYFRPKTEVDGQVLKSFGSAIVNKYQPEMSVILEERDNNTERINYLGNYDKFVHFDRSDISHNNIELGILKDKIVMLGFMGTRIGAKTMEDIYFTPLNHEITGRTWPDTYGLVIHANIVSMILRNDYINKMSTITAIILAFIICFLHLILFTYFFVKRHIWFHLTAKLTQLFTSILMLYIVFLFFSKSHYEINSTIIIASILLSVDVLYIYESIVAYLYSKKGIKSYFIHEH